MKKSLNLFTILCAFAFLLVSCGKKDSQSAATDLEKAFKPASTPALPAAGAARQPDQVAQEITTAITAIRRQSYDEAFLTLRSVQAAPNITVAQYSAIESARLAVEREVAAKAAAGDPAALRALKAIQNAH